MSIDGKTLDAVYQCRIAEMVKAGKSLPPAVEDSCTQFYHRVKNVEAALIHTYQLVAYSALQESDPGKAAALWKEMGEKCSMALKVLKELRTVFPSCGTPELYDLALDYKIASDKRYEQNLQDAECFQTIPPNGLFPKMS